MAETAGVRLKLDSVIDLPFEQKKLDFKMSLSGERLNNINKFLEVDLPPYGPYELGGRFQLHDNQKVQALLSPEFMPGWTCGSI